MKQLPKEFTFAIDYPTTKSGRTTWNRTYGLNAYYAGKHWAQRKKDAEYWHIITHAAIRRAEHTPPMFDEPVMIEMWFNDNLDCSNHAAMFKMIDDGMKGILIPDDSRKYVQGVAMYFHDETYILVRLAVLQNSQNHGIVVVGG